MKPSPLVLALALAVLGLGPGPSPAVAQSFEIPAEYISGQPAVRHSGSDANRSLLILENGHLTYMTHHMKHRGLRAEWEWQTKFTIPLTTITQVVNRLDDGDEYVLVTATSATDINVILFKVDANTSDTIAAKIAFAAQKARP